MMLLSMGLTAQEKDGKDTASTIKKQSSIKRIFVKDSIFMLQGKGGNIGVNYGKDGILLIDNQFAEATEDILAITNRLDKRPVKYLINTHHHGDHTGGNKNFNELGTVIYAHDNVKKNLLKGLLDKAGATSDKDYKDRLEKGEAGGEGENAKKAAKKYMKNQLTKREKEVLKENIFPMITFSENLTFQYNGQEIMALHLSNAHTDGDAVVYFTESNVLHTGDIFFNGRYPYIDVNNGGSYDGYLSALKKLLLIIDEDTKVIPGHGNLANKKNIEETISMMKYLKDRVLYYYASGKTKEEIATLDDVMKPYNDKGFGDGYINSDKFLDVIYTSTKTQYDKRLGRNKNK
ncbi:MAG: MBL fold metallo-hydrolase, partial [Bacteroidetes bacterium]|nr:MBL fold metallo-hydrolase [Bacteroidota bacterium]